MFYEKVNTYKLKKIVNSSSVLKDRKNIIALGIDQGYANLGYAIIKYNIHTDTYKVLKFGTIITNSKLEIQHRLKIIYDKLDIIIKKYPIDIISCESIFVNGIRNSSGQKTRNKSASIVKTNMSTGLIYLLSSQHNLKIYSFPPTTIKKHLTGSGKADKDEVIKVVEDLSKKNNIIIKTNHESDAIAIGITAISAFIDNLLS